MSSVFVYREYNFNTGVFTGQVFRQETSDIKPPPLLLQGYGWLPVVQINLPVKSSYPVVQQPDGSYRGYKYAKAAGLFIPPLYYDTAAIISYPTGFTLYQGRYYPPSFQNQISLSTLPEADYLARRNFFKSLSKRTDVQLGVFLAELKKSFGMVSQAVFTLIEIVRALKRGRISDALEALRNHHGGNREFKSKMRNRTKKSNISKSEYAANAWLELQFGWKPLLQDLHDIFTLLSERQNQYENLPWFSIHGYGKSVIRMDQTDFTGRFVGDITYKYAYNATYTISDSPLDMLESLGLHNPLSIAWEIVPFSFVVDWFLPIGDWIEAQSAGLGLNRLGASTSRKGEGFYKKYDNNGVLIGTSTEICFRRLVINNGIDNPPPRFTNPIDLLDGWHVVTSLALLKSVFGK